ncbi:hypothetical protein RB195_001792 [Necator americanus]|uniref:Leucine Rich repeat-containing domain protein n=1 Tax=Necator americanus TaxID=51031 RepID=A0ABR1DGH5_NECAM
MRTLTGVRSQCILSASGTRLIYSRSRTGQFLRLLVISEKKKMISVEMKASVNSALKFGYEKKSWFNAAWADSSGIPTSSIKTAVGILIRRISALFACKYDDGKGGLRGARALIAAICSFAISHGSASRTLSSEIHTQRGRPGFDWTVLFRFSEKCHGFSNEIENGIKSWMNEEKRRREIDLNTTNLDSLKRPEIVRTLTIRCPHFSKKKSTPAAGLFRGLHKLYSLIIKNARLPTIPNDLFAHTPNLMTLDMSGNELRIEPYSLKSLRLPEELSDLSLRHNFITTLHYAPPSVRNLRRIDLSGNMLEFISGSGSVNMLPAGLKQADLSNNRISFVQDGALSLMEKLALLDLKVFLRSCAVAFQVPQMCAYSRTYLPDCVTVMLPQQFTHPLSPHSPPLSQSKPYRSCPGIGVTTERGPSLTALTAGDSDGPT